MGSDNDSGKRFSKGGVPVTRNGTSERARDQGTSMLTRTFRAVLLLLMLIPAPLASSLVSRAQSLWISTCAHRTESPMDFERIYRLTTPAIATFSIGALVRCVFPQDQIPVLLYTRVWTAWVTTELLIVSTLGPIRVSIDPRVMVLASTLGGNGGVPADTIQPFRKTILAISLSTRR